MSLFYTGTRGQWRWRKEVALPRKALPPYHIGEQSADALLRPLDDTLAELDTRLQQYAERLRLADADRRRVELARTIVADAREQLQTVLSAAPESR